MDAVQHGCGVCDPFSDDDTCIELVILLPGQHAPDFTQPVHPLQHDDADGKTVVQTP